MMNSTPSRARAIAGNRLFLIIGALLLLGGVFTAGIVWSSLDHVEQRRAYRSAIDEAARLLSRNADLERENEVLKTRIARIERRLQVNQTAYDKLTAELAESSDYIAELRQDLDFYRSIISPGDNKAGVKIQDWQVRRDEVTGGFEYRLTVVQALDHEKSIAGGVVVYIEGVRDGVSLRLAMPDVGDAPEPLSFRYFQVIEGRFSLPESFRPTAAVVSVVTRSGGSSGGAEVERSFDWTVDG